MFGRNKEYRRIQRRLRELDRIDASHGLGAMPRRRTARRRGHRGEVLAALVTVVVVAALFVIPGVMPNPLREMVGLGDQRLLPPVPAPGDPNHGPESEGEGFAFLASRHGSPIRWDPCRPVRYEVNPAAADPAWIELVHAAAAEVETRTGLRLEYVGETERRPGWEADFVPVDLGAGTPALVAWATESEVPGLAGDVAGLGGAAPVPDRFGGESLARGGVTLDRDTFAALSQRKDGRRWQRSIVLHEFGHLVGLAHVDDPAQLMHHDGAALDFGSGDLAGLAAAGRGECR